MAFDSEIDSKTDSGSAESATPPPTTEKTPKTDRALSIFPGLCGARLREGGTCVELPRPGRSRCDRHGGLTPVGPRSPHFVSGRFSKYPVAVLESERERFERYRADPLGEALAERVAVAMI